MNHPTELLQAAPPRFPDAAALRMPAIGRSRAPQVSSVRHGLVATACGVGLSVDIPIPIITLIAPFGP